MSETLRGPSMLALVADMDGPTLWRVLQPTTALGKLGYACGFELMHHPLIGAVAAGFDGYVLPRVAWAVGHRRLAEAWFAAVRRAGKLAVYDADDDIFSAYLTHRALDMDWTDGKTRAELEADRFERIWALQQCDGVTVSTQRLATIVRRLTDRPVIVVPNAIDLPWFRRVARAAPRQVPGLTIGWAGGRRPDRDIAPMALAWGRLARRYADVTFVVAGHAPRIVTEQVPPDRLVVLPWRPLERYPESFAEIDIACCAVNDEPFNRAKSVIKAYESAIGGSCVVASPTVYGALIEHGMNGLVATTADEWEAGLASLIERPSLRSLLRTRLVRYVERHCSLAENVWRWPSAWREIAEHARQHRLAVI